MQHSSQVLALARTIWNYHLLHHQLHPSDAILVLGSNDLRVAEYGAQLLLTDWATRIVFSGGVGRLTHGLYADTEADAFADVARALGVPPESILIERSSQNTGENIKNSRQLLEETGLLPSRLIVVHKPYMERRTYAAFKQVWPDPELVVTSPPISFDDYPTPGISQADLIHMIVGDLQRIIVYPRFGFQVSQEIPTDVQIAFEQLVALGFTRELLPGATVSEIGSQMRPRTVWREME